MLWILFSSFSYVSFLTSICEITGRVMICHFSNIWVHFVFCQLNFIVFFSFLIKYYLILFIIIIVFWLGCDRPSGLLLFVPALLLSILTPLFLPSSSVSLSYFVLASCSHARVFGKTPVHEFPCPIAYWMVPSFFARRNSLSAKVSSIKIKSNWLTNYLWNYLRSSWVSNWRRGMICCQLTLTLYH